MSEAIMDNNPDIYYMIIEIITLKCYWIRMPIIFS